MNRSSLAPVLVAALPFVLGLTGAARAQGADPSDDAFEMGSPPALPEGLTEEDMWPAATAETWKQPCLVTWQRTFDDAMAVARAQQRPVMVAVNMDGEIASEHFAGVKYRDPETAAKLNRYACVIASVYRHTPRDYDEEGKRVECPRFGTVTCGEHIENERQLYDLYFDGQRVSPRHIVLDLEGNETFDVYFSWDTASVVKSFVKGVEGWPEPIEPGEREITDMALSPDVKDRIAVERAYVEGDRATKREILETLVNDRVVDQVEVLRTAIYGFDLELAQLAQHALARTETEPALELIAETLKGPVRPEERELLLGAVDRMAETLPRAKTLAALHDGLALDSEWVNTSRARALAAEYEASASTRGDLDARAAVAETRPTDPDALLELAEGLVVQAQDGDRFSSLWLEDAHTAARDAERLGASGARLDAILALTSEAKGEWAEARKRAVAAIEGGLLATNEDGTAVHPLPESVTARVVRLFAAARRGEIRAAFRRGEDWPPKWLSDVTSAHEILASGPLMDEALFVEFHDFLRWIGASGKASEVLDEALGRFPDSPVLHERLRGKLLWDGGPAALEKGYDRLAQRAVDLAAADPATESPADRASMAQLDWFSGYASLVAAEHYRRRSEFLDAVRAYGEAIASFERNIERFPDGRDSGDHFIALAHAGLARLALERGDLTVATDELLASFQRREDTAAAMDGLGLTPIATAKMVLARLHDASDDAGAKRLQAGLDALDPKLLEPPPIEQNVRGRGQPGGGGRAGQGRPGQRGGQDRGGAQGAGNDDDAGDR